jgi:hypothetical protein
VREHRCPTRAGGIRRGSGRFARHRHERCRAIQTRTRPAPKHVLRNADRPAGRRRGGCLSLRLGKDREHASRNHESQGTHTHGTSRQGDLPHYPANTLQEVGHDGPCRTRWLSG